MKNEIKEFYDIDFFLVLWTIIVMVLLLLILRFMYKYLNKVKNK